MHRTAERSRRTPFLSARARALACIALASASLAGCVGTLSIDERAERDAGPITLFDGSARGEDDAGALAIDDGGIEDAGAPSITDAGRDAGISCPAGTERCGGACVDTSRDPASCGRCGQACAPGGSCEAGICVGGVGCPPAPDGVSDAARAALERTNEVRSAMGSGCQTMVPAINLSAERHCAYYDANRGTTCVADPHAEVSTCSMFVGERFDGRMRSAGYAGAPAAENMHFIGDGAGAVQGWIDSVFHRNPVLQPWIRDMGYGTVGRCDTADYGVGEGAPYELVVTYPYPRQAGVPTSFDGRYEGPQPPMPETGWPSGYPITVYAQAATITSHRLTIDGDETDIPHVWVTPADSFLLRAEHVMYANDPLAPGTTYRVRVEGSGAGGPFSIDYTFTTQ